MHTYTTPAPITSTLELAGARVRITAADRADTEVRVEPVDAADRAHLRVADRTKVGFADGRLSVKTHVAGSKEGSVVITIALPTGSGLKAYLAYSDLRADGAFGDTELHIASGRVTLESVAALLGNIASGTVAIDRVAGSTKIDGGTFELAVRETHGTFVARNAGGAIRIGHAAGDVDLDSATCDVDIDTADADVTVASARGAIRIGAMRRGRTRLTTGSGDMQIGVIDGAAVSVDAESERGAVHDFTSRDVADAAAPRIMVRARTRHGDILVQRVSAGTQEARVMSTR